MSSRARVTWQVHPNTTADDVDRMGDRLIDEIVRAVVQPSQDMLRYAKSSHPWVNRTGEAEAGLNIKIEVQGDVIAIHLDHAASHGRWLEHKHSGRWGIIPESIRYGAPCVMAVVSSLIRR